MLSKKSTKVQDGLLKHAAYCISDSSYFISGFGARNIFVHILVILLKFYFK